MSSLNLNFWLSLKSFDFYSQAGRTHDEFGSRKHRIFGVRVERFGDEARRPAELPADRHHSRRRSHRSSQQSRSGLFIDDQ